MRSERRSEAPSLGGRTVTEPLRRTWQLDDTGPEAYERFLVPTFFAPCAELVVGAASVIPGVRVLDLACGTGIVARTAAPRVGPAGSVVGTDLNEGMLRVAAALARDVVPEVTWVQADAGGLPFEDGSFDVVCCQQGLQFFPDPAAATREVWRVLAANGRLVLAMWRPVEHNSVFGPFIEAIEAHAGDSAAGTMRSPFSGPSIETLRTMLSEADFEPVRAMVEVVRVRFPSVDEYVRREVLSSPLVGPIGDLRPDARDAFLGDVRTRLQPWVDDKGLGFTMETWIVVADKRPVRDAAPA